MFETLAAWLILPLGMALGWYMRGRSGVAGEPVGTPVDAGAGLAAGAAGHTTLNDDPDLAVASLLRATELDDEAVELHLTLGNLFRKRGEVDRALRLHESLVARPLKPGQLQLARFELAQDFLKAGLVDRAEVLFQELATRGPHVLPALEGLIAIYEQGRDWKHAIDTSARLQATGGQPRHDITSHYWCERAEEALQQKEFAEAIRLAGIAADEYPEGVRPSLILGKAHEAAGDPRAAIKALERVPEQDRRFLSEAIEPLLRCAQAVGGLDEFIDFVREVEPEQPPSAAVLAQARMMRETGMNPARYLAEAFSANPSWALLEQLLDTIQPPQDEAMAQVIVALRDALRKAAASRIRYRCNSCGLSPGLLFWQCPSCKQWGSITPVDDRLVPAAA